MCQTPYLAVDDVVSVLEHSLFAGDTLDHLHRELPGERASFGPPLAPQA